MSLSRFHSSSSMPQSLATTASVSSFKLIFEEALKSYKKKTKKDLITHPLGSRLQACNSPAAILTILQDQVHQLEQSWSDDERLRRWINPTINVLYAFSATLGEGVSLVFSPANLIFAGAGVLLLAAKDVEASHDLLVDIFERVENFFRRLEIYTHVPPTPAMTDMMVKIMVEVLDILGTATKEMKQSRFKIFLKRVVGITKLDDGLKRLDKMTNEEAKMANAELLRITHSIGVKVEGVDNKVQGVGIQIKDVDEKVQDVNRYVRGVDENVKVVGEKVQIAIDGARTVLGDPPTPSLILNRVDGKEAATEVKLVMQQIAYNVDDANRGQLRESLRRWQSPSDPSTNQNIACNLQHEGTAEWFSDGNIFEEWMVAGSLLWIHGKPGSGKSVLCSTIIQKTTALYEARLASMAYFYFDFRDVDKRSRRNLLPSLLVQLSTRSDPFCDVLSRLYKAHDDGARQPSDRALMGCLKEMLTLPDQGPVYLILDALDECPNTSFAREQVLDFVRDLVDLRLPSLHICVTSRPEVDIQDAIGSVASHSISLHDQGGQKEDIAKYVESVVHSTSVRSIRRWRDVDKDLVIKTLSEGADGMFRWVFCQLETLRLCLPQNIPRVLKELPTSLDETYERVLKEIVMANRHQAYRLLQCLTVASRPLHVEELAEILALDFDGAKDGIPELKKDWRWEDQKETVLSTCSSLISVVDDGPHRVVQFSHFSVKEFLTSSRLASSADVSDFHIGLKPAHTVIVKACLGVLLQSDDGADDAEAKSSSPLANYAAAHWVGHATFGTVSRHIQAGMQSLFDPEKPYFEAWLKLHDIDTGWSNFKTFSRRRYISRGSPLYYASLCGFGDLAAYLVAKHPQHSYCISVAQT
ncbi:hypothetical protein EDB83DRAFT_2316917 [Lactarius deliciosus]|nr:hypothetical protein EDB83DRAFT_2316917 [Lactarius deliciosus]